MKQLSIIIILFLPTIAVSQLFDGEDYDYNSEIIWGINKNTNGGLIGGFMVRYSRSVGDTFYETYGLELSNVKHKSESQHRGAQGQTFIYGKSNYLYAIRLSYGREKLLFKKATQQGVQISAAASIGPTFGLVNPYYVLETSGSYEKFDQEQHPSPESVAGPGKLLQGLGETNLVPGVNLKASLFFEFGTYRSNVAGVEIGTMFEQYTNKIILVPTQPNDSGFTSVFFTLFWGTRK